MSAANKMTRESLLGLYRDIIRSAKIFPSKNRARILKEIRFDFRKNASMPEGKALDEALGIATKGLTQLNMYSKLDPTKGADWSVTLDQRPIPDGVHG